MPVSGTPIRLSAIATTRSLTLMIVVSAGALLAAVSAFAGPLAPTAGASICQAGQLHGKVGSSSGAAGTITLAVVLRNGGAACTLKGFAGLRLRDANGKLPTHVEHGGLAFLNTAPKLVALAHNGKATILIAYSDVPTGNETSCPTATKLIVRPPGDVGSLPVTAQIGACNKGTLRESPILKGVQQAP
jgi:hypothetical protein